MINLLILLLAFVVCICMGRLIIPRILVISFRKRLFDAPDERKLHRNPVPRLGGVTFFPVIMFSLCFFTALRLAMGEYVQLSYPARLPIRLLFMVAGLTLLYLIGIADDLVGVRYRRKFIVQLLSALMLPLSGLWINDFYGLFGIYGIPALIGIPFTLVLVVFITNAINLIDGIDGLASGLSMVALLVFGILFSSRGYWTLGLLAASTIGILIPFFLYNVFGNAERGRKIFMGDTGSLTLGYLLSFLTVVYSMNSGEEEFIGNGSPLLVSFSVLLVPGLDVVRVVFRRFRNHKSLFLPDKTHIHHKFLDMGFRPRCAMVTILAMSLLFGLFTWIAVQYLNNTLVFCLDVLIWTVLHLWFDKVIAKRNRK